MQWLKKCCLFFLILSCSSALAKTENDFYQRSLFLKARKHFLNQEYQSFFSLAKQLRHYSLYPYLVYFKLERQLDLAYLNVKTMKEVDCFLKNYKYTPLANRLRDKYLIALANQHNWPIFLQYYRPLKNSMFQCYYLEALLATNQGLRAYHVFSDLWLNLEHPPHTCQILFTRWENNHGPDKQLLLEKLERAIKTKNKVLLIHLSSFLTRKEKEQLKFWFLVDSYPLLSTQPEMFDLENKLDRKIFWYGIHKLVRSSPKKLAEYWWFIDKNATFSEAEKQKVLLLLAIELARRSDVSSDIWLAKIKNFYTTPVLREWKIRNALRSENWQKVLYWIYYLPLNEQKKPVWQYWRARALAKLGKKTQAVAIYRRLANEVDYYGLLASRQLQKKYHPIVHNSEDNPPLIEKNSTISRAKELYALGLQEEARREWLWALSQLSTAELIGAAQLAKKWEWYDLAIIAAAKAKIFSDIHLRYPKPYQAYILNAARKNHLNPSLLWAVIRQESAFKADIRSPVGALGLMQLMPPTAKLLSKYYVKPEQLLDAKFNIFLGSVYLKQLIKTFNGNAILAIAAYNVGPTRIKTYEWLSHRLAMDIWIEILPWKETRDYVKNVCLGRVIYS